MTRERFWILMMVLGVVVGYSIGVAVTGWLLGYRGPLSADVGQPQPR